MTEAPQRDDTGDAHAYWYGDADSAVELLSATRRFRSADHEMRQRMSAGMGMNMTDLAALRCVIAHELTGDPVTPLRLAQQLEISGASTSKLLDRLAVSGHLERAPHPHDGRSRIVVATDHAHVQVRERLSGMHEQMLEIARAVPESARQATTDFLLAMADHLETEAPPRELTPPRE